MALEIGEVRRSQVITTFGPGAIIDMRAQAKGGGPVSVVVAGIDEWDRADGHRGDPVNGVVLQRPTLHRRGDGLQRFSEQGRVPLLHARLRDLVRGVQPAPRPGVPGRNAFGS